MIVDSSFIIAFAASNETNHARAAEAMASYDRQQLLLPITALTEAMSLIGARAGRHAQRVFWRSMRESGIPVCPVDDKILAEAARIDEAYADCNFGFVDATLLATCEAVRDARVLSFDSRLAAYRPSFASALEILP